MNLDLAPCRSQRDWSQRYTHALWWFLRWTKPVFHIQCLDHLMYAWFLLPLAPIRRPKTASKDGLTAWEQQFESFFYADSLGPFDGSSLASVYRPAQLLAKYPLSEESGQSSLWRLLTSSNHRGLPSLNFWSLISHDYTESRHAWWQG